MSFHSEFGTYNGLYGNISQTFYFEESVPRPITISEGLRILENERLENIYREENHFRAFYFQKLRHRPITIGEAYLCIEYERLENIYREKNRFWEKELDALFECNGDFSSDIFETKERFRPNEESKVIEPRNPTLEERMFFRIKQLLNFLSTQSTMNIDIGFIKEILALCKEISSSLENKEEVETCVSPQIFEEHLIESESCSLEIQSPSDDESLEIEFISSPFSFTVIEPLEVPPDSYESVETFETFTPFTDEDPMLKLFSKMDSSCLCDPLPILLEKSLGSDFILLGSQWYLSPCALKSLIIPLKCLIGDGSFFPSHTCLPFFQRNSYFLGGMLSSEGTPLIPQSQIVFWVDPQIFRLLVYDLLAVQILGCK